MPSEVYKALKDKESKRTIVERSRPDLPAVISRSILSISQAGYNTIAEILNSGTPAVVVPYEGGVETEQRLRADLLAKRSLLQIVDEKELTAKNLEKAIRQALKINSSKKAYINLDGAASTANALWALL